MMTVLSKAADWALMGICFRIGWGVAQFITHWAHIP